MKASAAGGVFIILVAILIAVAVIFALGNMGNNTPVVTVISNATFNTTIETNNTIIGGGVTIPAENVTAGIFGNGAGDYTFSNSLTVGYLKATSGGDLNGDFSLTATANQFRLYDTSTKLIAQIKDGSVVLYASNGFTPMFTADRTVPEISIGVKAYTTAGLSSTGGSDTDALTMNGNITYAGSHCEIHQGTQANFSRCFNATGQVTEKIGVFPV
jgi:hypothetical protein